MKGLALLFAGAVCTAVGFLVWFQINAGAMRVRTHGAARALDPGLAASLPLIILWSVGGLLILLGGLAVIRGRARQAESNRILASGVEAAGAITFLDRNWTLRVNGQPVYSIVEYRFHDATGREFVRRIDEVPSEAAIRAGWQVGSQVKVRYLPEDPSKSMVMFARV
jgi:hypothetical protein